MLRLAQAVASFRADPSGSVLLFDFDGTLSPTVPDPAAAEPAPGVVDHLTRLAEQYRLVGVISGRPVAFLVGFLPVTLRLSGLYGLESVVAGTAVELPAAAEWRDAVTRAVETALANPLAAAPGSRDGMYVEPKGLSVTLHYRTRPDLAGAVNAFAQELGAASGLEVRAAKQSVELHPPVESDKGAVVRDLAAGASAVLYVGDDVGDLPAFAALAALRDEGVTTLAVAVGSVELPEEMALAADLVVDGQRGMLELLDALDRGHPTQPV